MARLPLIQKSKEALNKAKQRNRESLDRAYSSKVPLAQAKLDQLRAENHKASRADIQQILDEELMAAEVEFGVSSVKYSSFATMYVVASAELRELDISNQAAQQKLMDLIVILDSKVFRFVRRAAPWALMFAAPYLKGSKIAQAAASSPVAKKMSGKVIKKAGRIALPLAKELINKVQTEPLVSRTIITKTNEKLGPVPGKWPDEGFTPKAAKRWFRRFKR